MVKLDGTIASFDGEYAFLSNFHPAPIHTETGDVYPTAEHCFQAMKTDCPVDQERIRLAISPGQAKRIGRTVKLTDKWESLKDGYMSMIVEAKFVQNPDLRQKLLATGDADLIEGNTWHDNYWGNCTCPKCTDIIGRNQLGMILMYIREKLAYG